MTWRAVTVRQPWVQAIAQAADDPLAKLVENRKRGFPRYWRGQLMIHSGAGWSKRGADDARVLDLAERHAWDMTQAAFPRKAVVAVAELADVHDGNDCCEPWGETTYTGGDGIVVDRVLHLVLEDVIRLPDPVPVGGLLGLWVPPQDVVAMVERQLT